MLEEHNVTVAHDIPEQQQQQADRQESKATSASKHGSAFSTTSRQEGKQGDKRKQAHNAAFSTPRQSQYTHGAADKKGSLFALRARFAGLLSSRF